MVGGSEKPRRTSRSRRPCATVSTVSTSASNPAAAARSIISLTRSRFRHAYTWNQSRPDADGADLFDGAGAERRQGVRQPGTRRGPGDGEFACGVGDAGEPGRGEDKWIADRSTEQRRGDIDVLDAAQDPRAERGGGECGFVGGQRALVFRTTVDVVEHAGRQATLRDAAKIGDGSGSRQPSLHAVRLDAFESDHRTQGVEGPHDVSYLRSPPGPASRSRLPSSDARRS